MALSRGRPEWRWLHQPPPGLGLRGGHLEPEAPPAPPPPPAPRRPFLGGVASAEAAEHWRRSGGSLLLLPLSPRRPFPSIPPPRRLSAILAAAGARRAA